MAYCDDNGTEIGLLNTSEFKSFKFKVVLLGNGTAGKSSLIQRLVNSHFGSHYMQTVGVDFYSKQYYFGERGSCTLTIVDIGGQTLTSRLLHSYIRGTDAVLLTYDITQRDSFEDVPEWHDVFTKTMCNIHNERDSSDSDEDGPSDVTSTHYPVVCGLLGTKSDLMGERVVTQQSHDTMRELLNVEPLLSLLTSSKSGHNVECTFTHLADVLFTQRTKAMSETASGHRLTSQH